jgi:hypothetical protein
LLSFSSEPLYSRLLSKNLAIEIYGTIILPLVLYGHETLSLILGKKHRLTSFQNKVLRKIFGPKNVEVRKGWRKQHDEECDNL